MKVDQLDKARDALTAAMDVIHGMRGDCHIHAHAALNGHAAPDSALSARNVAANMAAIRAALARAESILARVEA